MRTISEYVELVKLKHKSDHEITGISWPEAVDFVVDNAFFTDEIGSYQVLEPLKEKLLTILKETNN